MIHVGKAKLYTVGEVADLLHVSKYTIQKYIRQHRILFIQLGRQKYITEYDIEHFLTVW